MARDFNGSSDKITYTLTTGQHSFDDITIAAWFHFDAVAQYAAVFRKGGGEDTRMEFDDGWGMVFVADWTSNEGKWSIAKPSTGVWVHIGVTYSFSSTANDPVIYKDGVSQAITERVAPSGTKVNTGTSIVLGTNASTFWMNGRMAEFGIWNRQFNASEMLGLGKGFSPSFYPRGLVFYSNLMGRNSPELELIKGSNGTLTGTSNADHPRIIYPANYRIPFGSAAAAGATPVGKMYSFYQSVKRSNFY